MMPDRNPTHAAERPTTSTPVRLLPGEEDLPEPSGGVGLCLSGGGYRAMLFHVGVVRRLDEAGILVRLDRISSVSGGSITAGALALAWPSLELATPGLSPRFEAKVQAPLLALAGRRLDTPAVLRGLLSLRGSISDQVADAYRRHLFGDARLADLPATPRFIINATNLGSGALVRFERSSLADWRVGRVADPDLLLAKAVASSSAFPPYLSPHRIDTSAMRWTSDENTDLAEPSYRDELVLSDGGVYDNLGLETVWKTCKTVLVSDAGGQMPPQEDTPSPWPQHMVRVLKVVDNQVRSLRKRQVIEGLRSGDRSGVYVGIRSDIAQYEDMKSLPAPVKQTEKLAKVATRLRPLDAVTRQRLVNWGYAICDAGVRRHMEHELAPAPGFPYPEAAVGGKGA